MASEGDSRSTVLIVSITLLAGATVFVALRFLSRALVVRKVVQSDYWMLLAWVGLEENQRILSWITRIDAPLGYRFCLFVFAVLCNKQGFGTP